MNFSFFPSDAHLGIGQLANEFFNSIGTLRDNVLKHKGDYDSDPEWRYHVRAGLNALRLAQVHFYQLSGTTLPSGDWSIRELCHEYSEEKCEPTHVKAGIGVNLVLTWITCLAVITILLLQLYRRLRDQNELSSHVGYQPPVEEGMPFEPVRQLEHETHQMQREISAKLNRLTVKLDDFIDERQTRFDSELDTLRATNRTQLTDIGLWRHKADEAQIRYYAVSLIPRIMGAEGDTVHDRLRNCLFRNFTLPEVQPDIIRRELGIPTPPGWILTSQAADDFITAHLPGLGSRLSWEKTLPGVDPAGGERFKRIAFSRHHLMNKLSLAQSVNSEQVNERDEAGQAGDSGSSDHEPYANNGGNGDRSEKADNNIESSQANPVLDQASAAAPGKINGDDDRAEREGEE